MLGSKCPRHVSPGRPQPRERADPAPDGFVAEEAELLVEPGDGAALIQSPVTFEGFSRRLKAFLVHAVAELVGGRLGRHPE